MVSKKQKLEKLLEQIDKYNFTREQLKFFDNYKNLVIDYYEDIIKKEKEKTYNEAWNDAVNYCNKEKCQSK